MEPAVAEDAGGDPADLLHPARRQTPAASADVKHRPKTRTRFIATMIDRRRWDFNLEETCGWRDRGGPGPPSFVLLCFGVFHFVLVCFALTDAWAPWLDSP